MTKEQAKNWIYRRFNSGEAERLMADLIIKALEQKPVIDKIRAEIESLPTYCAKFQDGEVAMHIDKNDVLQIINKYETNI